MATLIEESFSYMIWYSITAASQFFWFQTETETESDTETEKETETFLGLYELNDPSKIGRPTQ